MVQKESNRNTWFSEEEKDSFPDIDRALIFLIGMVAKLFSQSLYPYILL